MQLQYFRKSVFLKKAYWQDKSNFCPSQKGKSVPSKAWKPKYSVYSQISHTNDTLTLFVRSLEMAWSPAGLLEANAWKMHLYRLKMTSALHSKSVNQEALNLPLLQAFAKACPAQGRTQQKGQLDR